MPPQPVRRHARRDHPVFKRYHLFGFTGTPIFAENSGTGGNPQRRTTEQAFGDKLHTYTIVDAINDKNVLPFRIDYINTIKTRRASGTSRCRPSTRSGRCSRRSASPRSWATSANTSTRRPSAPAYRHDGKRLFGFNSLFATASIDAAKRYYAEFAKQQKALPEAQRLKVGLIYSFAANEDGADGLLGEEEFETEGLDPVRAIFWTCDPGLQRPVWHQLRHLADKFQNYYKDLSQRLKKRELDLVIVVNMFLTGFDATTLNTLWVDKNLKARPRA
jgi:type I restriction enzyme R subunit